jgi:hypothetical protein
MALLRARVLRRRWFVLPGVRRLGQAASLTADVLADCLEARHEAAAVAVGIGALEAGGAEVFVLVSGAEHVPDDHEHRVGDGGNHLVLGCGGGVAAVAGDVPVVQGLEVAVVADRLPEDLDRDGRQVDVPVTAQVAPAG